MNRLFITLSILLGMALTGSLTGCGGGGGGGGATNPLPAGSNSQTAQLFKDDLAWLQTSQQASAKATNAQLNNALTKAFGGEQPTDVHQFISARVKHVYSDKEMNNFLVTARIGGHSQQWLMKDLSGGGSISNGTVFQAGANEGASLAMMLKKNEQNLGIPIKMTVALPTGNLQVKSFRVGLVSLTQYYSALPDQKGNLLPVPPEVRVSTLVHEGRHSDCPQGIDSDDCAFGHRNCTSGPATGVPACDNSFWGPYALEAIYLQSTLDNYPQNSREYHIIQMMTDDAFSRLTQEQIDGLRTTDPLLGSI